MHFAHLVIGALLPDFFLTTHYVTYNESGGVLTPVSIENEENDLQTVESLQSLGDISGHLLAQDLPSSLDLFNPIENLPWSTEPFYSVHIKDTLKRAGLSKIGVVLDYFEEKSFTGETLGIHGMGEKSYQNLREVFRKFGLELPEVELIKRKRAATKRN